MPERRYYVYIIANATLILYTGMCNNLHRRVWELKTKQIEGFTSHFNVCRLVYWESFDDVRDAINREKQIKRWRRGKKIWLIERMNRNWKDLSEGWYDHLEGKTKALPLDSGFALARGDSCERERNDKSKSVAPRLAPQGLARGDSPKEGGGK